MTETSLSGAFVIDRDSVEDERGFFSRSYDEDTFTSHGMNTTWPQENISYNTARFTLRGMHFADGGFSEAKTVECTRGSMFDVIVDIRPDSPSLLSWYGIELSSENRRLLYIPEGFAHGFLTLESGTEIRYRMGKRYEPAGAAGFRWNDPAVDIEWPARPVVLNQRDRTYADIGDRLGGDRG